jgi:hypothetical protein
MSRLVFVPMGRAAATSLRDAGTPVQALAGTAVTRELLRSHEYSDSELEDAEFAALSYAGVLSVLEPGDPLRLIVVAEVPDDDVTPTAGDPYGTVTVHRLSWSQVQSLFSDEAATRAAVGAARSAAQAHALGDAVGLPPVQSLTEDFDLLWFAPEELDLLP